MKDFTFKPRSKCYKLTDDKLYKRKCIDFNEYGLNKYEMDYSDHLNYDPRKNINCVKRDIKRNG